MKNGAAKIYTKGGDKGKTSLIGGTRVAKSDPRLETYGTIDELNSFLGLLLAELRNELSQQTTSASAVTSAAIREGLESEVCLVQHALFNIGSQLACEDASLRASLPNVTDNDITALEHAMDEYSLYLTPLKNFILPGGSRAASVAHVARTVCRRAERLCLALPDSEPASDVVLAYLNRLSDYLFVLARHLNRLFKVNEPVWQGKSADKKT